MKNNYINHVLFVVDNSGSMDHLRSTVVKVFDNQIEQLAKRSKELDQETRVTVFQFDNAVQCLVYDKDVLRLPSLRELYKGGGGMTALIDAVVKSVSDLRETPERYGDHAFLGYVLTDGMENASRLSSTDIKTLFSKLPENWTLAVMVPDQQGVFEAKRFGFPVDNIAVWSASAKGCEEVGKIMTRATDSFMVARASGLRSTNKLFTLSEANLTKRSVQRKLDELDESEYKIYPINTTAEIRPFIEKVTRKPYVKGSAYYQLTKPETIQSYKEICVRDRVNDIVYAGANARGMLGLPDTEIRVAPGSFDKFDIFVQSTSINRKLVPGTELLVRF